MDGDLVGLGWAVIYLNWCFGFVGDLAGLTYCWVGDLVGLVWRVSWNWLGWMGDLVGSEIWLGWAGLEI